MPLVRAGARADTVGGGAVRIEKRRTPEESQALARTHDGEDATFVRSHRRRPPLCYHRRPAPTSPLFPHHSRSLCLTINSESGRRRCGGGSISSGAARSCEREARPAAASVPGAASHGDGHPAGGSLPPFAPKRLGRSQGRVRSTGPAHPRRVPPSWFTVSCVSMVWYEICHTTPRNPLDRS